MLRKFVNRLFSRNGKRTSAEPKIFKRATHGIARDAISPGALKVTQALQSAGFKA